MARRDLSSEPQVLDVSVGQTQANGLVGALADAGIQMIKQGQQAKITENSSKAQLDIAKLDNEFRIKAEADPFNKELGQEYLAQRNAILDTYKGEIDPSFRMDWDEGARRIAANSDAQMQAWQYKQTNINTKTSISNAMENNFLQANQNGMTYGQNNDNDPSALLDFSTSQKELTTFITKNLGQASADAMLKNYQRDYFKSFISGVAQTNPQKADQLLKDEAISKLFDSEDLSTFGQVIRRNIRQKSIDDLVKDEAFGQAAFDVVYSDDDYFTKRNKIDKMELSGELNAKTAAQARRVLSSTKALNTLTSSEHMSDIIDQMYDLNAIQETDSEGYITGVNNLRNEIFARQSNGDLSAQDAQKLDRQLRSLSGQKMAQSTQRIGVNFYDQKERFKSLPPQFRGEATRELFYRSQELGEKPTAGQLNTIANKIIDEINTRNRQQAEGRVKAMNTAGPRIINSGTTTVVPPLAFDRKAFMAKYNISDERLAAKAKQLNMSEDEVLHQYWVSKGGK